MIERTGGRMKITERVLLRLERENPDPVKIEELVKIITDRLCLRLHEETLPKEFDGIAADATVKLFRRVSFEGIESEWTADIKTEFVSDVLAEYDAEIAAYKEKKEKRDGDRTIFFL